MTMFLSRASSFTTQNFTPKDARTVRGKPVMLPIGLSRPPVISPGIGVEDAFVRLEVSEPDGESCTASRHLVGVAQGRGGVAV